ncbi:DUF4244 domain-containing protein [Streptomyces sp. NPDC046939]|uniref:DUF4244 domain-containing protein n=1 Tax=Streptomyces sp. NPDC046939 TaxID=3155376 RepID=UPI0033F7AC0E
MRNKASAARMVFGRLRAGALRRYRAVRSVRRDAGMVSAEYAVGLIAAVGFAGLLYQVVTSGAVRSALQSLVAKALHGSF